MTEPAKPKRTTRKFRPPGRPSKLTADLRDRIVATVAEGNYLETAAHLNGVHKAQLYRWLRRADDIEAAALEHFDTDDAPAGDELFNHVDPAEWPYLEFRDALKSAEAHAERWALRDVRAAQPGWQAHMTFLERRHPARWGRRDRVEVDAKVGGTPRTQTVAPGSDERVDEITSVLSEALGRPAAADLENSPDQED